MERIMIIEDNEDVRTYLARELRGEYEVLTAGSRQEAVSLFKIHMPKVVTLDLGLPPDEDGTAEGFLCLNEILHIAPHTKVITITGSLEREHACWAVMNGAYDYYCKPIDLMELKIILRHAFNLAGIEQEGAVLKTEFVQGGNGTGDILGNSASMREVFTTIRKVAASDVAVLITGESGTGKELAARAIHRLSARRNGALITINCGAIPENLIESELFGHEKGSFSGAHSRVQRKVEFANRGTLFLDEIGELPLALQVKLLRFLQDKIVQRVGGREELPVDTRIIAATNRDIAVAAAEKSFREDLYYRLSVITIHLPPLRERDGDIMLLANQFLYRSCHEFKKRTLHFSAAAMHALESYGWPGNVRELEHMVQRAVIMSETRLLEPEDLGLSNLAAQSAKATTLRDAREQADRSMIIAAIETQHNNMAKAARMLGISRPTLYDLARKHGLLRSEEMQPA